MAIEGNEIDLNDIPESAEDALKLLARLEAGDVPETPAPEVKEPVKDEKPVVTEPITDKQKPAASTVANDEDSAGVATKDGKHVIPYSVLKNERDQRTQAMAALTEMTERTRTLEAALAAAAKGGNPDVTARVAAAVTADASDMSDADMESLKEDFPTVYKALQASKARSDQLAAQLLEHKGFKEEIENASRTEEAESLQDVIDANPKLAFIQSSDANAFGLAVQFDDTLKNNPAWAVKPMAERFAKVIEMVEQASGVITVPGGKSDPEKPAPTAADLKAAALALAKASASSGAKQVPTSLSEFPVGESPAQDELEALDNMSTAQIADRFSKMKPDQLEAFFAKEFN